ncbi:non-ribosomal peptide synthetase [Streptomyces mashuensis]|nr:amino acid adenylation domain-containing protein [Streptomyces mashuensis]
MTPATDPARSVRQDHYLLHGPLDAEAFTAAWQQAVTHHADGTGTPPSAELVRTGPDTHELCCTYDGQRLDPWTLHELLNATLDLLAGTPLPEPAPRTARDHGQPQDPEAAGRYWAQRLAGFRTPVEPRIAGGRPDARGTAAVPLTVPEEQTARLARVTIDGTPALPALVEAAWVLVLSAYAETTDIVVGAVRPTGPVPVRAQLDPAVPLGRWLRGFVEQAATEQAAPLAFIEDHAGAPQPLFDSVTEWADPHPPLGTHGTVTVTPLRASAPGTHTLGLALRNGPALHGELRYDTARVSDEAAGQLARQFLHVLGVLGDEEQHARPLAALDVLPPADRARLVDRFNDTAAGYDADATVLDRFATWVADRPDAVAVEDGPLTLTYAELDRASARLAAQLAARGVTTEHTVGVCFERSAALVVAMLAVLRAGAGYLPLDPGYPGTRLRLMTADTGTRVVLADARTAGSVPVEPHQELLVLGPDGTLDDSAGDDVPQAPAPRVLPDSTAYVVYTSGSTGAPKGVVVPHRALTWFVANTAYLAPGPDDVVALASSPAFDALTFECWVAFAHGARLTVIPKDVVLSAGELARTLRRAGVTLMYVTAALLEQLSLEVPDFAAGLRVLLFGGQQANADAVALVRAKSAPARLVQVYGPTETTVWNAHQTVADGPAEWIPLGRPIENSTEYVLDRWLRPAPAGVPGEVFIGGDGVTRGYLGRPGLTATRFLPNPFGPGRLYRTGDLARFRGDGSLEFLGRADQQVKIRGFRIELGEVEAALRAHAGVSAAVVAARDIAGGGPQLVAWLVPEKGAAPLTAAEVRAFLTDRLPGYMIPAIVIPLDRVPLGPTGKADHKALPLPLTPEGRLDRRALARMARRPTGPS